jgi:hypothetical protein
MRRSILFCKDSCSCLQSSLSPQLNLRVERQWGNHNIINADTENRVFLELSSSFGAGLSIADSSNLFCLDND